MSATLLNAFLIALREIRRNLMRAFLTVLGIIIGVAAVVTMVTLGQATTQAVRNQISNLGSNLIMIRPGAGFGPMAGGNGGIPSFSEKDVEAVRDQVPGVVNAVPVRNASLSTVYLDKARTTPVVGSTTPYFQVYRWNLAEGRFFDEADVRAGAAVAVIGNTVRKELFGDEKPIGAKIRVGKASVEVIGLLTAKGQAGMGDQDDTLIMPLTAVQRRLVGKVSAQDISNIAVSVEDNSDSAAMIADLTSLLRTRRNLEANEDNNFSVFDTRQIAETLSSSTKMMTTLLTAVAGVSLMVGGIGIMNIMLVSVTERTREIGIRLSIGARAREVLLQFLVEAVTLSTIGGFIGILFALALCAGLAALIHVPFSFNLQINAVALLFSMAVGILFGFTPARRAARLDPIEALRYE